MYARRFLAALSLAAAAPLPALAAPFAGLAAEAPAADVERLVAILLPDQQLIDGTGKVFSNAIADETGLDAASRALFAANPGLKDHVAGRVRSELGVILRSELPDLRGRLATAIVQNLTPQDVRDTLGFFASPTGAKVVQQMYGGIATSGASNEEEAQQAGMSALMASLTPDDYPALMAFGASPAAAKLQTVTPRLHDVARNWGQSLVTRHEARLMAVAQKAVAEFLEKKK